MFVNLTIKRLEIREIGADFTGKFEEVETCDLSECLVLKGFHPKPGQAGFPCRRVLPLGSCKFEKRFDENVKI